MRTPMATSTSTAKPGTVASTPPTSEPHAGAPSTTIVTARNTATATTAGPRSRAEPSTFSRATRTAAQAPQATTTAPTPTRAKARLPYPAKRPATSGE